MARTEETTWVLLVDDDAVTRRLIGGFLRARGLAVTEVSSLATAAMAIAERAFAAAIVDLHLPDGNGMEFVHLARRGPYSKAPQMVIAVCSAYVAARTTQLLMRLGADAVFPKPPEPERLMALLAGAGGARPGIAAA
jgi:CheY-like chemotaxis protein